MEKQLGTKLKDLMLNGGTDVTQTHLGDRLANSISHGVGFALAIAGTILLVMRASSWLEISVFLIYGISLMMLFLFSTLHHSLPVKTDKAYQFLLTLDMVAIYFLIAGTYTPFMLLVVNDATTNILFIGIWAVALIGATLRLAFPKQFIPIHVILYVVMGWSIVFIWPLVSPLLSTPVLWLVFLGGITYTSGIFFFVLSYFKRDWHYVHMVWHLMVLLAAVLHYFAVFQLI